jgi:hypothetical protein
MYQLSTSIGLSRSIGSQFRAEDLSQILVFDIFTTYTKVYLVLTHTAIVGDVYVDLDTQRAAYSSYAGTLQQWLVDLGTTTLPTVPSLPSTTIHAARYADAVRSGYHINLTQIGINTPDNYPVSDLHDLRITRPTYDTDLTLIHQYGLVSVNGHYHRTDTDGTSAYVYKGADTLRRSHMNHLGILSFLDIGAITHVPLDATRIYGQTPIAPLQERIYFDIDQDLTNRSVILILGGYLVFPSPGVLWQSSDHTMALDITQIPYPERIFESSHYIDLGDLGLSTLSSSPDAIDTAELYSDRVIRSYMTLSQSWLAIIDTPHLTTNPIHLRRCDLPGMFTSYQDPTLPLIVNYGRVAEYWKTLEDGYWSVTVADSFYRRYILSEQPISQQATISPHVLPHQPFAHSQGHLLEILGW